MSPWNDLQLWSGTEAYYRAKKHFTFVKLHTLPCQIYTFICKIYTLICKIYTLICKICTFLNGYFFSELLLSCQIIYWVEYLQHGKIEPLETKCFIDRHVDQSILLIPSFHFCVKPIFVYYVFYQHIDNLRMHVVWTRAA